MAQPQRGDALGASYRLRERIGAGAAGEVWRIDPIGGGPPLAAKLLRPEHARDPALVERFVRERSVLLGLRHPGIVEVHDLVVEGETLAIVMELVHGGSLRELLDRSGPLAAADALELCAEVLRALAAAHAQRITHRDIKPDNVLLARPWAPGVRDAVRVADFGIAAVVHERSRRTTGILGTPEYLAPELISHGQVSPAADVYSAGVVLYELLSGRTPFAGAGTDFTIAFRHVTLHPPELALPAPIRSALTRLLSKDPGARPVAAEAAAELARLAEQHRALPPLDPPADDPEYDAVERSATRLRSVPGPDREAHPEYVSPLSQTEPEIEGSGQRTTLRPMPSRDLPHPPPASDADAGGQGRPAWLTRKTVLFGAIGAVLLVLFAVGIPVLFGEGPGETERGSQGVVRAAQQDPPLPTGLRTERSAEFDPQAGRITLAITYSAQRVPLAGELFAAVPVPGGDGACPVVVWEGAQATRHQHSVTGLRAECGWRLSGVEVPANGSLSVTASVEGAVADEAELDAWLVAVAAATDATVSDAGSVSTAYPAQRLRDIEVRVPPRAVSQTPLEVTLLPVWPSGPDELNPLFKSPAAGPPSRMLFDIAGGEHPVRLADGCSGAVAIAPDGITATALSVTSNCRLRATVGNFTSLESTPFSITTRE